MIKVWSGFGELMLVWQTLFTKCLYSIPVYELPIKLQSCQTSYLQHTFTITGTLSIEIIIWQYSITSCIITDVTKVITTTVSRRTLIKCNFISVIIWVCPVSFLEALLIMITKYDNHTFIRRPICGTHSTSWSSSLLHWQLQAFEVCLRMNPGGHLLLSILIVFSAKFYTYNNCICTVYFIGIRHEGTEMWKCPIFKIYILAPPQIQLFNNYPRNGTNATQME